MKGQEKAERVEMEGSCREDSGKELKAENLFFFLNAKSWNSKGNSWSKGKGDVIKIFKAKNSFLVPWWCFPDLQPHGSHHPPSCTEGHSNSVGHLHPSNQKSMNGNQERVDMNCWQQWNPHYFKFTYELWVATSTSKIHLDESRLDILISNLK